MIRALQNEYYAEEKTRLLKTKRLSVRSHIRRLLPMLDGQDIYTGRLHNAYVAKGDTHPIIIPGQSSFAKLLIRDAHERTPHGGAQLATSVLQREFWLTRGRIHIRSEINRCIECRRRRWSKNHTTNGHSSRCSSHSSKAIGLDYAGPYMIRTSFKHHLCRTIGDAKLTFK